MSTNLADPQSTKTRGQGWAALVVISLAQLMIVLDATIVNIALPAAGAELGFGDAERQWVISAFSLAFGALLLLGGRVNDRIGHFRGFVIGAAGFAIASAMGGWAPTLEVLIVGRAAQGVFAALLAPAALGLLTVAFNDSPARDRAFSVFGALSGAGLAIGLILGGALTELISWRWTLYVNVFFALVAIVGAYLTLPRARVTSPREPFDLRGSILAVLGSFGIVYGLGTASSQPIVGLPALVAGIVLIVVFARSQKRAAHPLLPPEILADRIRGTSSLVMLIASVAIVAVFVFAAAFLQNVMYLSPIDTGVAFLPMMGAIVLSAQGLSLARFSGLSLRVRLTAAPLLAAVGMVLLAQAHDGAQYAPDVLPGLILTGLGLGVIFASTLGSATQGVASRYAGVASAVVNSAQQIGTSLGIALLTAVSGAGMGIYLGTHLVEVGGMGPVLSMHTLLAGTIAGYQAAFLLAAAVFVAVAIVAFIRYPSRTASTFAETTTLQEETK